MAEAMSKKEKLARGSAVIKVMRVTPRSGHYLSSYIDVYKMPKKPKQPLPKGLPEALLDMPHLDLRNAWFKVDPYCAKISEPMVTGPKKQKGPCDLDEMFDTADQAGGLPYGHPLIKQFDYRGWVKTSYPLQDGNLADHLNNLLGLLMTMTKDPDNTNFPDVEAYPLVQFLRTIKTPEGEFPHNVGHLIEFLNYLCLKMAEDA